MTRASKILSFDEAPEVLDRVRAEGKTIVQCHGTFDLLHPGHIIHFEEAKELGDILVVTITGDKYVNKGMGRPFFNDQLRVKSLASLDVVDYVIVVPYPAAVEAIECVRPDVYCKGKEYERPEVDVTGNIYDDLRTVKRLGGKVCYVGSVVFSSTSLLNQHFEAYSRKVTEYCQELAAHCSGQEFRRITEGFRELKVLVIGEVIFDRYSTTPVQGLTSKNRILSARFVCEETQAGGALAILRHVKEFTPHVKIISLVGVEPWVDSTLRQYIHSDEDEIVRAPEYTTIVKQRFVEPLSEGKELSKLFSVNYIDAQYPDAKIYDKIYERIASQIEGYDLVIVADFGHGLMVDKIRDLVQEKSPFMALNCQTNSNNYGYNIINRQYHRADSFSLDEREVKLACGRSDIDFEKELERLRAQLGAKYAWLTRGLVETISVREGGTTCVCPPLEVNVVDTVGAGDAFYAVTSLAAVRGLPIKLATFMGQLAGAQAVRIVGNSESIKKSTFLKSGVAMLNF